MFTEKNIKAAFKMLCEMYDEEDRWMPFTVSVLFCANIIGVVHLPASWNFYFSKFQEIGGYYYVF